MLPDACWRRLGLFVGLPLWSGSRTRDALRCELAAEFLVLAGPSGQFRGPVVPTEEGKRSYAWPSTNTRISTAGIPSGTDSLVPGARCVRNRAPSNRPPAMLRSLIVAKAAVALPARRAVESAR